MKTSLICILVSALTVSVYGGGGGEGGGGAPISGGGPPRGGGYPFENGGIRCGPGDDYGKIGSCVCAAGFRRNMCSGKPDSQIGCPYTNQYVQCTAQVCSVQNCTDKQVWNKTLNACAACATGMHVAANGKICVCDSGKTFDPVNKTCVPCPTGSTQEADTCYCPATKAIDYKKNACVDCPAGSTLTRSQQCQCSATQFWNDNDWACQDCPGEWLPKPIKRIGSFRQPPQKCVCNGTNQIFDRQNVKCYTCPSGTTASKDNSNCICASRLQYFNMETEKCECFQGTVADAAGCVRPAITISPTPGAGSP